MSYVKCPEIEAAAYSRPLRPTDVLRVRLEGAAGERWSALGGGENVGEALAFALASSPESTAWRIVGWRDAFGD